MSTRHRLTRRAAPAPAIPTDPEHPAMQADPDMHKYENGDTSSWAEDPHMGPYEKGGHPALPDEGPAHPAYKSAADIRVAAEQKAAKCIRIAQALLGDAPESVIEDQAFPLMHLADADLDSTLERLAHRQGGRREASVADHRFARIEHSIRQMQATLEAHFACGEPVMADEEAMLAEMLKEDEAPAAVMADEEAMLAEMLTDEFGDDDLGDFDPEAEEMLRTMLAEDKAAKKAEDSDEEEVEEEVEEASKKAADDEEEVEEASKKAEDSEEEVEEASKKASDGDMDIELNASLDDMDIDPTLTENDTVLASLFATAGDEEEVEEEEEEIEEASKKASAPRPQPRKASTGARTVGSVTGMSRAASDDLADLQKLWTSAPDVSDYFKG